MLIRDWFTAPAARGIPLAKPLKSTQKRVCLDSSKASSCRPYFRAATTIHAIALPAGFLQLTLSFEPRSQHPFTKLWPARVLAAHLEARALRFFFGFLHTGATLSPSGSLARLFFSFCWRCLMSFTISLSGRRTTPPHWKYSQK